MIYFNKGCRNENISLTAKWHNALDSVTQLPGRQIAYGLSDGGPGQIGAVSDHHEMSRNVRSQRVTVHYPDPATLYGSGCRPPNTPEPGPFPLT